MTAPNAVAFTATAEAVKRAASWAVRAVPRRAPMQVLYGVKITTGADGIRFLGFNYETEATETIPAPGITSGEVLVPGRLLLDYLRALPPKSNVTVDTIDGMLRLVAGEIDMRLPLMAVEDYPADRDPLPSWLALNGAEFTRAIAPMVAAGSDDTLPFLTGVRWEVEAGTLSVAATDRYRLAYDSIPGLSGQAQNGVALIPAAVLRGLSKAWGGSDSTVIVERLAIGDEHTIRMRCANQTVTTRCLTGEFPKYLSLIPDAHGAKVEVERKALIEATRRAFLATERNVPVRLGLTTERLVVSGGTAGQAQVRERIPAVQDGDLGVLTFAVPSVVDADVTAPRATIALNPGFLLDGCEVLTGPSVTLLFNSSTKPVVMRGDGPLRYLLMPVKVAG